MEPGACASDDGVSPPVSVVVPYSPTTAATAARFAQALAGQAEVVLAGEGAVDVVPGPRLHVLSGMVGKGAAMRAAVDKVTGAVTVIQEPDEAYTPGDYEALCRPIQEDTADAVFGRRIGSGLRPELLADRALGGFTRLVTDVALEDPLTGVRAFRTEALRSVKLTSEDEAVDAELVVKLAAQLYRLAEVPLTLQTMPKSPLAAHLTKLRTLVRYATVRNDADNQHEGYTSLERMDGANNYNAWLGQRFREHLGRRVLEIGAGIGTITRELETGLELLIALEVDTLLRGPAEEHVPGQAARAAVPVGRGAGGLGVAEGRAASTPSCCPTCWSTFRTTRAAVRRFRQILPEGGKVVILVPALPQLFGAIDEAVGHYRRYTPETLRAVLEGNGLDGGHAGVDEPGGDTGLVHEQPSAAAALGVRSCS